MPPRPPTDELEVLASANTDRLAKLVRQYAAALVEHDEPKLLKLREQLLDLFSETMAKADSLGAAHAYDEIQRKVLSAFCPAKKPVGYAAVIKDIPFEEALDDLLAREPTAEHGEDFTVVQDLYRERHAFAAVKALHSSVAQKVQEAISKTMQAGASDVPPSKVVSEITGWSRAYADTVYRTNLTGAYSAGRLRQAMDPDVEDVVVGLRYVATMDSDTRKNHAAADGVVAAHDDPIWYDLAPPCGYNCRCSLELVDRFTAEREGLLVDGKLPRAKMPPGAGRDNKFPGRPDLPEKTRRRGEFLSTRPDVAFTTGVTIPTRRPDPKARPMGKPKVIRGNRETKRSLLRENECSVAAAQAGFTTTQLPEVELSRGPHDAVAPDILLGMHLYDAMAPVGNVATAFKEMQSKAKWKRAPRMLLHIDDLKAALQARGERLDDWLAALRQSLRLDIPKHGDRIKQVMIVETVDGQQKVRPFWPEG
jgi:SPP1 gp7 family putative phage head morphogenesis protein